MNIDELMEHARLKGRVIALEAEVQTLQAEVRCLEAVIRSHERVDCLIVANLKAENERLRKAGDEVIQNLHPEEGDWCFEDAEATWHAAKEGKQP